VPPRGLVLVPDFELDRVDVFLWAIWDDTSLHKPKGQGALHWRVRPELLVSGIGFHLRQLPAG
jgi:hypothetical protein